jgi:hypothetical protein
MLPAHPLSCPVCSAIVREVATFKSGECWLAQVTIGERVGRSPRAIRTHLRALESAGVVQTQRRGLTRTNVYALVARPRRAAARCRSGAAKTADNTITDCVSNGLKKQAPGGTPPPPRSDALSGPTNGTTPRSVDPELIVLLVAAGVSSRRSAKLVVAYDADRIRQQLAWLRHRPAANPGALLATAIVENYPEPSGARIERAQQAQAEKAIESEVAEREREAAARAAREADQWGEEHALVALPPAKIEALRSEAYAKVDTRFPRFASRTGVGFCAAVETAFREMLLAEIRNDGAATIARIAPGGAEESPDELTVGRAAVTLLAGESRTTTGILGGARKPLAAPPVRAPQPRPHPASAPLLDPHRSQALRAGSWIAALTSTPDIAATAERMNRARLSAPHLGDS